MPKNSKKQNASKNIIRAEKMQRLLEKVAYYSIFMDFLITLATLASINMHKDLQSIMFLLNVALSAIVVFAMILFVIIFFLSHYDKIIDKFALMYARSAGKMGNSAKKSKKQKQRQFSKTQ